MSEHTAISWTDATWNPWMGCDKVSPGCDLCYMFRDQRKYGNDPELVRRSKTKFSDPLKWKEPRLIFTCSWSDFFHAKADAWRPDAWDIIRRTPQHTYQVLTKRPSRIERHLPPDWGAGYPNVWLGVSAESQEWAERRVPILLSLPARIHWVSAEPLLGPIEPLALAGLDWIVLGGESGPGFRPMDPEWLRPIIETANGFGVPVHVKQDSALLPGQRGRIPDDLWVQEWPAVPPPAGAGEA